MSIDMPRSVRFDDTSRLHEDTAGDNVMHWQEYREYGSAGQACSAALKDLVAWVNGGRSCTIWRRAHCTYNLGLDDTTDVEFDTIWLAWQRSTTAVFGMASESCTPAPHTQPWQPSPTLSLLLLMLMLTPSCSGCLSLSAFQPLPCGCCDARTAVAERLQFHLAGFQGFREPTRAPASPRSSSSCSEPQTRRNALLDLGVCVDRPSSWQESLRSC